jgi:hypothetical protein
VQEGAHTHLSASQCRDLTALANNAPITHARNLSEVAALREAVTTRHWASIRTIRTICKRRSVRSIVGIRQNASKHGPIDAA